MRRRIFFNTKSAYVAMILALLAIWAMPTIVLAQAPEITCPTEPIILSAHDVGQVCIELPIINADTVIADDATWGNDTLCFISSVPYDDTIIVSAIDTIANDTASCEIFIESEGTIKSGTIAGETWIATESPYFITGNILVASLNIDPGIEVIFCGDYSFEVMGIISAIGTQTDSIIFKKLDGISGWQGILFDNTMAGSILSYCNIRDALNSGIRMINNIQTIENCTITNCISSSGGAIYLELSTYDDIFELQDCIIDNNSASNYGGGICAILSTGMIRIDDCEFTNCNASYGGGVYVECSDIDDTLVINNCILRNDTSSAYGGGIGAWLNAASLQVKECIIEYNFSSHGGGIAVDATTGNFSIEYCQIEFNKAEGAGSNVEHHYGGGVHINNVSGISKLINCRINSNLSYSYAYRFNYSGYAYSYGGGVYANGDIFMANCVISNNTSYAYASHAFPGGSASAHSRGAGTYLSGNSNIFNCIISCNTITASAGGPGAHYIYREGSGFYVGSGSVDIINCNMVNNNYHGIYNYDGILNVQNSIVYDNYDGGTQMAGTIDPEYCLIQNYDTTGDTTNIDGNPIFYDPYGCDENDLIILYPSPCIDAGNPDPWYNDRCFPPSSTMGGDRNDIGAHGGPGGCGWLGLPVMFCPGIIDTAICNYSDEVCIELKIINANYVIVDDAIWTKNQLCFTPISSGQYVFDIIAGNDSGEVNCQVVVNVMTETQLDVDTDHLSFGMNEGSAVLPNTKTIHIDSPCDPGSLDWDLAIIGGSDWLEVDKTSGTNPDSVIVSIVDSTLAEGIYTCNLKFNDPQAYNSPRYVNVTFFVDSGVDVGDYVTEPDNAFRVPIDLYTNKPLSGFTIPLTYSTSQPDQFELDSVVVDTNVMGPSGELIVVNDTSVIAYRPIQEPPLPDSLGVSTVGWMYFTVGPDANDEVIFVDTATLDYNAASYSYQFIDDMGDTTVPKFDPGIIMIGQEDASGQIINCLAGNVIPDVSLELVGPVNKSALTNPVGWFGFDSLAFGDYTMTPSKDDTSLTGVSVADVVKMRRHLATIEPFGSPCQMIAADINGSCNISVADIVKLRRCIARLDPCQAWTFVDADFDLTMQNWCTAPDYITFNYDGTILTDLDFIGVRMGDVNGTWSPFAVPPAKIFATYTDPSRIAIATVQTDTDAPVLLPITLTNTNPVAGLELHLKYDTDQLIYTGVNSDLPGEITLNETNGEIHIVWDDIVNPIEASQNKTIVNLGFKVRESIADEASVSVSKIELVNPEGIPYEIETSNGGVTFSGKETPIKPDEYSLRQNYPNPFNPTTTIELNLPVASQYELEIYNITGRLVRYYSGRSEPGVVRIDWDGCDSYGNAAATGVYLYRAKAGSFSATKKMILLK